MILHTSRLVLFQPPPEAAQRVARYYDRNRAHHRPYDPRRPHAFYTAPWWTRRLALNREAAAADQSLCLFLAHHVDGPILGSVNFTGFARGPFQCCKLGYSLDEQAVGQGYMTEALRRGIAHVFGPLGMHRIEANHAPDNVRSAAVLRRLEFVIQGYARDYLFIDGAWRDHVLTARTNPSPRPPG